MQQPSRKPMPRIFKLSITAYYAILILVAAIGWLKFLIPLNFHDPGFFFVFILFTTAVLLPWVLAAPAYLRVMQSGNGPVNNLRSAFLNFFLPLVKQIRLLLIPVALLILFFVLNLIGMPIIQAKNYASLIDKQTGDFTADISEIEFYDIPTVDFDTANRLGNKKMGEIPELVSQFEVDPAYVQINYQDKPVRVTPLAYGDLFKWLNNRKEGLPRLIRVDMTNGEVTLQELPSGMKYSKSEPLFRNIKRHLRLRYPFTMMAEPQLEIDEEGTPYWVVATLKPRVGWFNGLDVQGVILCNALDGTTERYAVEEAPTWIDRIYPSDMILEQLNNNGRYQSGWINSRFGQRGVLQTTSGYNYLAINDDVYLYTGITSVTGDSSNLGFVLVNMRTKETKFYPLASADEESARNSAEGAVQEKGYRSTFPILLNIGGRPTYCMALKDAAELIKMYALVDAQDYQNTAVATTITDVISVYKTKMMARDPQAVAETPQETEDLSGRIADIKQVTIEGNTFYYLLLENRKQVFVAPLNLASQLPFCKVGDHIKLTYVKNESINMPLQVTALEVK